jgi:hypothetical protein
MAEYLLEIHVLITAPDAEAAERAGKELASSIAVERTRMRFTVESAYLADVREQD